MRGNDLALPFGRFRRSATALFYAAVLGAAGLSSAAAMVVPNWPTPEPITYGTVLSPDQLKALFTNSDNGSQLTGTTTYDPLAGTLLAAGQHTLAATFVPDPGQGVPTTPVIATVMQQVNLAPLLAAFLRQTLVQYDPLVVFSGLVGDGRGLNGKSLTAARFNESVINGVVVYEGAPLANSDLGSEFNPLARMMEQEVEIEGVRRKILTPLIQFPVNYNWSETLLLIDRLTPQTVMIDAGNDPEDPVLDYHGEPLKNGTVLLIDAGPGYDLANLSNRNTLRNLQQLVFDGQVKVYGLTTINPNRPGLFRFNNVLVSAVDAAVAKTVLIIAGSHFGDVSAAALFSDADWRDAGGGGTDILIDPKDADRFDLGRFGTGKSVQLDQLINAASVTTDEDTDIDIDLTDLFEEEDLQISSRGGSDIILFTEDGDLECDDSGTPNDLTDDKVTYTPRDDFFGDDSFTYGIGNDETPFDDTSTVTITVNPVNDPPVATNITIFKQLDDPLTFDPSANDRDPDGDDLTVTIDDPLPPFVTAGDNNEYVFDPPVGFEDDVTFTYTVADTNGLTDTADITIDVIDFVPQPIKGGVFLDIDNNRRTGKTVVAVDSILSQPTGGETRLIDQIDATSRRGGMVRLTPGGVLEYIPPLKFYGIDFFDYTMMTPSGRQGEGTAVLTRFKKDESLQLLIAELRRKLYLCWPDDARNTLVLSEDLIEWRPEPGPISSYPGGKCLTRDITPGEDGANYRIEQE